MQKHPKLVLVGARIRQLRKSKGYSQEAFALESHMTRGYFGGVERGERNLAALNLIRIAEKLDVEVGELFPSSQELKQAPGGKKMGDSGKTR